MQVLSHLPSATPCTIPNVADLEFCQAVYLCVRDPKFSDGEVLIPENYRDTVMALLIHLWDKVESDDYIYVTLRKQHVQPRSCGNREGWHVDGFLSDDRSFIWFDKLPTQAAYGVFDVEPDHETSLRQFNEQVDYGFVNDLPTETLIELGDTVHRPVYNNGTDVVLRTFIKIVLSKEKFNGLGNAWNYLLPHIKPTRQRGSLRNHTVI